MIYMEENKESVKKTTPRKSAPKKQPPKEEVMENDLQAQMQQMMQMMAQQQQMFMAMMQQTQMQQAQPIQETEEKPKKQTRVNKGTVKDRGMTKQGLRRKYRDTDIYVQSVFQGSVFYKGKKDDYSWDVKGEVLLHYLEQKGIYVSTGSACSSKKKGSHVLNAIGLNPKEIDGAIRFSLSDLNTKEEMIETVKILKESVGDLRMIIRRR